MESDSLYKAFKTGGMHRNFMGYSASKTQLMIGLGASSIGDSWYSFGQNEKKIETYYELLKQDELPIVKGHILTEEDLMIRKHILNLMCNFKTTWHNESEQFEELPEILNQLQEMEDDGLLILGDKSIEVTEEGKAYVRNICMAFDLLLKRKAPTTQLFSMTI